MIKYLVHENIEVKRIRKLFDHITEFRDQLPYFCLYFSFTFFYCLKPNVEDIFGHKLT